MKTLERLINASSDPDYYRHELKELDSSDKTRLQELAARLERAGAAQRALSEVTENIAQTARFFALRDLCAAARSVKEVLDCCDADDASAVSGALLKAGARSRVARPLGVGDRQEYGLALPDSDRRRGLG